MHWDNKQSNYMHQSWNEPPSSMMYFILAVIVLNLSNKSYFCVLLGLIRESATPYAQWLEVVNKTKMGISPKTRQTWAFWWRTLTTKSMAHFIFIMASLCVEGHCKHYLHAWAWNYGYFIYKLRVTLLVREKLLSNIMCWRWCGERIWNT